MNHTPQNPSAPPPFELTDSKTSNWALIRRLLGLGWRYRAGCIKVLLQQLTLVSVGLGILGLTGLGIDVIRDHVDPSAAPPRWPFGVVPPTTWSALTVVGAITTTIVCLALLNTILRYWATVSASRLAQTIIVQLRTDVYDKLQRLSFRFFDTNNSSSLINRVAGDVQAVRVFVDGVLVEVIVILLSLLVYMYYMLNIHVTLTLACLATTPLLWATAVKFSSLVKPAYVENRRLIDRMVRIIVENTLGMAVVKGFAQEENQIEKFRAANDDIKDKKQEIFWLITMFQPFMAMLTKLNLAVLLGYGGYLIVTDKINLGVGLFVFAGLLQRFADQVGQITNITNRIQASLTGAGRVFEVLDAPIEIQNPPNAIRIPRAGGEVRFENVSFGYGDDPILHDVNLEALPGQCVAIVGPTGAGKSTLLSLIPRLYDPTAGRLLIDGRDVRQWNLDDLRGNIGFVFQESFVFSHTAASNIAFGHPQAARGDVERAAKLAAAHDFLVELPDGYDTVIGEHGCNLSGGQRQRLAIARALLLDPPILVFDDPTASIDPRTEDGILEAMENAMRGRTTFVVAHRLATLRRADMVVVLENGRIAQIGTPDELIKQDGHFSTIAGLQLGEDQVNPSLVGGGAG